MSDQQDDRPVLSYARPTRQDEPPEHQPLVAALLCLPGLGCWAILCLGLRLMPLLLLLWVTAIGTAIASLAIYGRHPLRTRPWYVIVCLFLNICGLVFSVLVLASLL
jgi:hypothetical protein